MRREPANKRTIVFVDGQNLFHGAREAFGYPFPNYDIFRLASDICIREKFSLVEVRFYTGVRVSLARWWAPQDANPGAEQRCYLQLSRWY